MKALQTLHPFRILRTQQMEGFCKAFGRQYFCSIGGIGSGLFS